MVFFYILKEGRGCFALQCNAMQCNVVFKCDFFHGDRCAMESSLRRKTRRKSAGGAGAKLAGKSPWVHMGGGCPWEKSLEVASATEEIRADSINATFLYKKYAMFACLVACHFHFFIIDTFLILVLGFLFNFGTDEELGFLALCHALDQFFTLMRTHRCDNN